MEIARRLPMPRIIGSHLPIALLPDGLWRRRPKILYIATTPSAIVTEWYADHFVRHGYNGSLADFVRLLVDDSVPYAPVHSHIAEFWSLRNEPNCWFVNGSTSIFNGNLVEFTDQLVSYLGLTESTNEECLGRAVRSGIAAIAQHQQRYTDEEERVADKLWKRTNRTDIVRLAGQALSDELRAQLDEWTRVQLEIFDSDFRLFETEIVQEGKRSWEEE